MCNLFSKRLKELRLSKGLKQSDLAKTLDIGTNSYQKYELNQRFPKPDILINIADYFNVSLDYLVGRTNNPKINK